MNYKDTHGCTTGNVNFPFIFIFDMKKIKYTFAYVFMVILFTHTEKSLCVWS